MWPEMRDHPLVFNFDLPTGWLDHLALPEALSSRHEIARCQIVANALEHAESPQPWTSYSRRREHYAKRGPRYDAHQNSYAFEPVVAGVDDLSRAGLLEAVKAPPDPTWGRQSTFRAAPALLNAMREAVPIKLATPKQCSLIRLRDEDKQYVDYRETERTHRSRGRVRKINEAVCSVGIELPPGVGERVGDFLRMESGTVNLGATTYYRVFNNGSWREGGRFYGPFWQSLPKQMRKLLMIDGEAVSEPDYNAHHIRIIYALEGKQAPLEPYEIEGWDRSQVKNGLLYLINASTYTKAVNALTYYCQIDHLTAVKLIRAIKHRLREIRNYFHSGAGVRLQYFDSEMAGMVMLGMAKKGVPALGVHDSFIVPARHEAMARELMDRAFYKIMSGQILSS
jgi:hypothetical protein